MITARLLRNTLVHKWQRVNLARKVSLLWNWVFYRACLGIDDPRDQIWPDLTSWNHRLGCQHALDQPIQTSTSGTHLQGIYGTRYMRNPWHLMTSSPVRHPGNLHFMSGYGRKSAAIRRQASGSSRSQSLGSLQRIVRRTVLETIIECRHCRIDMTCRTPSSSATEENGPDWGFPWTESSWGKDREWKSRRKRPKSLPATWYQISTAIQWPILFPKVSKIVSQAGDGDFQPVSNFESIMHDWSMDNVVRALINPKADSSTWNQEKLNKAVADFFQVRNCIWLIMMKSLCE